MDGCGAPRRRATVSCRASSCPVVSPPTRRRGFTSSAWPAWPPSSSPLGPVSPSPSAGRTGGRPTRSATVQQPAPVVGGDVHGVHRHPLMGQVLDGGVEGTSGLTWMTGVLAFVASIVECFTGYVSQQNFDSQWISTSGKDAINATGLGGFFNLLNFGQMLLWHVVLLPVVLVALVGAHVLLVRVRGVSHPLPVPRAHGRAARSKAAAADGADWTGPTRVYDILKEAVIATGIVTVLVFILAAVLSSPDVPAVSLATWGRLAPADFMGTAVSELNGTSETAMYGPPYNNGTASVQRIGISWQQLAGVRIPIDTATDFVLDP